MNKVNKIKRGLDIRIKGKAEKIYVKASPADSYAVKPIDFPGMYMPKLLAKPGDTVKAGSPLFFDKKAPDILFCSPVSGTVNEVVRGERRKILEVEIEPDKRDEYEKFSSGDPAKMDKSKITENLLKSGLWPAIRQRPYAIIANPGDEPRDIFISGFDTAPLAPDMDVVVKDYAEPFQLGVEVLKKLTKGKVHISVNAAFPISAVYSGTRGTGIHRFKGPHPAGNVGIQIHHIKPVNKGELVWYVNPQEVISIGRLFMKGVYDASKIIALTGSEVKNRRYFKLMGGASIEPIVKDNLKEGKLRYISGNVLTGTRITKKGHLGYYDSQVTVIPEGDHYEFLGWVVPGINKFSASHAYPAWLQPNREYRLDTNLHGGERAYVMTGEYEKVLPMDLLPVQLVKSILIEDIDKMEQLGIYEVAEEDLALCEFVCTSKIEVQQIIRHGINLMIKELG